MYKFNNQTINNKMNFVLLLVYDDSTETIINNRLNIWIISMTDLNERKIFSNITRPILRQTFSVFGMISRIEFSLNYKIIYYSTL